jgi:hypothetical protein
MDIEHYEILSPKENSAEWELICDKGRKKVSKEVFSLQYNTLHHYIYSNSQNVIAANDG